ncbi:MAG TPA: LCP family protein [Nocardioidaceae bacterium]|nr:LCP family protein [Nocardioidaceae bacterium]
MGRSGSKPGGRGVLARHKALIGLLGLACLLVGGVGVWAVSLSNQISAIPRMDLDLGSDILEDPVLGTYDRPDAPDGDAAGSVNILIAGVDAGESARIGEVVQRDVWIPGEHRSDTIMVLHLSADRRNAYLISVPRDTWVPIDGYGMAKINAAFSYGGPPLFVRTLEQFTGLRLDHLVLVDWKGFMKLVDALGGVEVHQQGSGLTRLDGEEALDYVRERRSLPRGDLDRINRQQNVVRSLSGELTSRKVLLDPLKLTEVLGVVTSSLAVDESLTDGEIRRLALSLRSLDGVAHMTVPVEGFGRVDGQSIVRVDTDKAKALFGAAVADELEEYTASYDVDTLPAPAEVD